MRWPFDRLRVNAILAVAISFLVGCAPSFTALRVHDPIDSPAGDFVVESAESEVSVDHAVELAASKAAGTLQRWGHLRDPVYIRIVPSHEALEDAVAHSGYPWLRAWARYDEVFLQSPRSWGLFGSTQAEVDELVLHELTHCLMYQLAGTRTDWTREELPLWFREGMATSTAGQGYRWPSLDTLARFYERHPGVDPVQASDQLYRDESDIVYGAAYHAFAFLQRRYGDDRIRELLRRMAGGERFGEAFSDAIGLSPEAFVKDFRHYVVWRGFAASR